MDNTPTLTSTHNGLIKQVVQWQERSRARRKDGVFVVEGLREIDLALGSDYQASMLFYCPEIVQNNAQNQNHESIASLYHRVGQDSKIYAVSQNVYKKIAYRNSTEGIVGVFEAKQHRLADLNIKRKNPLIMVAEAPEKPGNIGALLRTADAAGVDAFLLANPRTDLYNPNIIRSSVGGIFTTNLATGTTQDIIDYLQTKKIAIYSAILQEAIPYTQGDYTKATALVVGTEADGLSETWRSASSAKVKIPMNGSIDSMNVSVSAGILVFEALRQRMEAAHNSSAH